MLTLALATLFLLADRPDVVVADFESNDYKGWKTTGNAFGEKPAHGTLPGQMEVSGFLGHGLVNSFLGGDDATGTLTSLPFRIERPYLNFLIGGGMHPGETCLDLLVDGQVARSTTGPNDRAGGTERLDWAAWDVSEFLGKSVMLRIVDNRKGGWGHINVDQIVQSDRKRGVAPVSRVLTVDKRYLHLPVTRSAPVRRVGVDRNKTLLADFDIRLTPAAGKPDFWVFLDLEPYRGRQVNVTTSLAEDDRTALEAIRLDDTLPDAANLYREADRPALHFTSIRGWLNDPNGLVYKDGVYHLYYQHNPYGWEWGNMHWGHATSPDLLRWTEQPIAISPRKHGDWVFSGSAVVDTANTSGLGKNGQPPIVAAFTSTGRGECIVYSNDNGMTYEEIPGNPVVKHEGRDPRLLWHAASKQWVMAVYDESQGKQWIAFHTSPDLKKWTYQSRIEGFFECPDLFELPIEGEAGQSRWVIYAADGKYHLGAFDGKVFTPETPAKLQVWHGNFYAAQSYSNMPDGRRIQVGWGQGIEFPRMAFNQQMVIPVELTLKRTNDGLRVLANPIRELNALGGKAAAVANNTASVGDGPLDIELDAVVGPGGEVRVETRGIAVKYSAATGKLSALDLEAPLTLTEGKLALRILVDRGSVEVFGNHGRVALSKRADPRVGKDAVKAQTKGDARVEAFRVVERPSVWLKSEATR
ncbi:MAG: GH32 C-terminal domain-containing protein [Isosphaeraceae bacterium]